jgi:hypothetical protein
MVLTLAAGALRTERRPPPRWSLMLTNTPRPRADALLPLGARLAAWVWKQGAAASQLHACTSRAVRPCGQGQPLARGPEPQSALGRAPESARGKQ